MFIDLNNLEKNAPFFIKSVRETIENGFEYALEQVQELANSVQKSIQDILNYFEIETSEAEYARMRKELRKTSFLSVKVSVDKKDIKLLPPLRHPPVTIVNGELREELWLNSYTASGLKLRF